ISRISRIRQNTEDAPPSLVLLFLIREIREIRGQKSLRKRQPFLYSNSARRHTHHITARRAEARRALLSRFMGRFISQEQGFESRLFKMSIAGRRLSQPKLLHAH